MLSMEVDAEMGFDELLIEEIKSCQLLYNPQLPEYKDFDSRQSVWKRIVGKLMDSGDETNSIAALKVRWKSLRNAYIREVRYEMARSSGENVKPKKPWRLKEQMDFLAPFIQIRQEFPMNLDRQPRTNGVHKFQASEVSHKKQNVNTPSKHVPEASPERRENKGNIFNQTISDDDRRRLIEIDNFFREIAEAVKCLKPANRSLVQREISNLVVNYKLQELEDVCTAEE